ncbi:MAG: hypothetical protein M1839_006749 [Geoglossum umbratile]|nr:MAG: hypothetical protein M1839_006749 [Geoglossum umbratile]
MESMGLPCYHLMQQRLDANKILYLHDFHPRWFFDPLDTDFIQIARPSILNPDVIRSQGRPVSTGKKVLKSSTRQEPSKFELMLKEKRGQGQRQARKQKQEQVRKQVQKQEQVQRQRRIQGWAQRIFSDGLKDRNQLEDCDRLVDHDESEDCGELKHHNESKHCNESEYHDLEEDSLIEKELQHLKNSNGEAPPLFTEESDLQGMTRATRALTRRYQTGKK